MTRPSSIARFERRQGRGAAHSSRAEPEATRQAHLPWSAAAGHCLPSVGVASAIMMPQLPDGRAAQGHGQNSRPSLEIVATALCNRIRPKAAAEPTCQHFGLVP